MTDIAVQTQLAVSERPFKPVPGPRHYVPVLLTKKGELLALANASAAARAAFTPVVVVLGPKQPRDVYNGQTVANWVKRVAASVGTQPMFLDFLRLPPNRPAQTGAQRQPVWAAVYEQAFKRGLLFVPVWRIGTDQAAVPTVRDAVVAAGRGVALRYAIGGVALRPGATHKDTLVKTLRLFDVAPSRADLLLDLGFLPPDSEFSVKGIKSIIAACRGAGPWRSVVLLGTSMPSALSEIEAGTVGFIPRQKWKLWREAAQGDGVVYGDYGIQHPTPPSEGGPGMRANVRYTGNEETTIARGLLPVTQEGNAGYVPLCKALIGQKQFERRDFSWGDRLIYDCAKGYENPGAQDMWRAAGTSHHIEKVTRQLARLP